MGNVALEALEGGLRGEDVGSHIVVAFISACENLADFASSDLRFEGTYDFLPCLLPS